MSRQTERIRRELDRIARENGGILLPTKVVEAARPNSSVLHCKFEWNNTKAAAKYRIWQARQLISVTVNIVGESESNEQVWVSLKADRERDGGYRSLVAVMSDADLRAQLLRDAYADMEVFENKYKHLQELADVFSAITRAKRRQQKKAA
jgi:hypothetical protein